MDRADRDSGSLYAGGLDMDREWAWVLLIQWAALWDQTLQEAPAWAPSWVLALPPMSDDFLARVSLAPLNSLKVGKGYCRQSLGRRNRYLGLVKE